MQKDRTLSMEHCISQVSDRFELVSLVSQRARDLASGHASVLSDLPQFPSNKSFTTALHEIDMELLNIEGLKERYMASFAPKSIVELQQNQPCENSETEIDDQTSTDSAYYVAEVDLDSDSSDSDENTSEHIFFEDVEIDETEK